MLGRVSQHMQTPGGYLSVLAIPAMLVIVVEIVSIVRTLLGARASRRVAA
jgi:hypothetical protein